MFDAGGSPGGDSQFYQACMAAVAIIRAGRPDPSTANAPVPLEDVLHALANKGHLHSLMARVSDYTLAYRQKIIAAHRAGNHPEAETLEPVVFRNDSVVRWFATKWEPFMDYSPVNERIVSILRSLVPVGLRK